MRSALRVAAGRILPVGLVVGIALTGLSLSACDANQDEIAALESQVSTLKEEKVQVFDRLDQAQSERDAAQSQLSVAREDLRSVRGEVSALRDTVDYLNSQIEALANQAPGSFYAPPPEEDFCQDFYDVGVDCPLDNLDVDPFD